MGLGFGGDDRLRLAERTTMLGERCVADND